MKRKHKMRIYGCTHSYRVSFEVGFRFGTHAKISMLLDKTIRITFSDFVSEHSKKLFYKHILWFMPAINNLNLKKYCENIEFFSWAELRKYRQHNIEPAEFKLPFLKFNNNDDVDTNLSLIS